MKAKAKHLNYRIFYTALLLLITCTTVNAEEASSGNIPKTEINLESGHILTWESGPFVQLCQTGARTCLKAKMPKIVGLVKSISVAANIATATASWKASSDTDTFVCALASDNKYVTCAKVPSTSTVPSRAGMKIVKLDPTKALTLATNVLEGELSYARVSAITTDAVGGCGQVDTVEVTGYKEPDYSGLLWQLETTAYYDEMASFSTAWNEEVDTITITAPQPSNSIWSKIVGGVSSLLSSIANAVSGTNVAGGTSITFTYHIGQTGYVQSGGTIVGTNGVCGFTQFCTRYGSGMLISLGVQEDIYAYGGDITNIGGYSTGASWEAGWGAVAGGSAYIGNDGAGTITALSTVGSSVAYGGGSSVGIDYCYTELAASCFSY